MRVGAHGPFGERNDELSAGQLAEEPKNAGLLRDALYELTGRKLVVAFAEGAVSADPHAEEPAAPSEDELYELMKETFDARDVEDQ